MTHTLSYDQAKELVRYCHETGCLFFKTDYRGFKAGDRACRLRHDGRYRVCNLHGASYLAHRLVFFLFWGRWPRDEIDHKDRDGLNNRLRNLRECTRQQNQANRPGKGYGRYRDKWRAKGAGRYLGLFRTAREAREAYLAARRERYGEFAL